MNTSQYYQHKRPDLFITIRPGDHRILEIGCAEGQLGELLKAQGLASEVVGVELNSVAAKLASVRLDKVLCGDIEMANYEDWGLEPKSFHYVICGDVLEHLRDPWHILASLANLLKDGGSVIVSLPNVQHWGVSMPLLFCGQWQYKTEGILDRTHLRFFTYQSAIQLVMSSNLQLISCQPRIWRRSERLLNKITFGLFEGLFTSQWVLVGKVKEP